MARVFIGFLMIFMINKTALSFNIFGIDFEDIKVVYNYVDQFYQKTEELRESPALHEQNEAVELHDIMRDLKEVSKELNQIQTNEDVRLDTIVKVLLDNIEVSGDLRTAKSELLQHIKHVEYLYNKSMVYDMSGSFSPETLQAFFNAVLHSTDNLFETSFDIFTLIFPGPYSLLRSSFQTLLSSYVEANYERICDKGVSEQQRIFYIFMMIIQTHLKAIITITEAYSLQFAFGKVEYPHEYKMVMLEFHTQLTKYLEEFVRVIRYFPRDIRRCDYSQPKIGIDVLELKGLFQVVVNTESELRKKLRIQPFILNYAQGSCEDIESQERERFVIYDCKTIDSIRGCPVVNSNWITRFSWWKTDSDTYGHPYECPHNLVEVVGGNAGWVYKDVCACSVNYTNAPLTIYNLNVHVIDFEKPKIMWIAVESQMSDITNNMVVVGVRFIVHDSSIHLQIKQSKLWNGYLQANSEWKPVDLDNNNKTIPIHYSQLHDRRNIMYLDDVGVDPRYVVTGVRLQLNKEGNGYELHVHGTEYIHETSQLGTSQMWYKPGDYPISPLEYQRERTEIHLVDPDNPTITTDYHPDPGANKFVQFQHSSVRKDGGYHTVPFFDAQPVTAGMHSPLGGIGLFYRGHDGFGGYIAPRLFTFNVTKILESSITKWMEFDRAYRHCYDQKLNVTVFDSSADCAKFGINTKKISANIGSFNVDSRNMSDNASTTMTPHNMATNDSAEVQPGHLVGDHVATTERPSSTGDTFTNKESPLVTTELSRNISTIQSISDHVISKPLSSGGDSSTARETSRASSDMSVTAATLSQAGDTAAIIILRNRSRLCKRPRLRKIERPLMVLRRNESSILYSCDTRIFRTQIAVQNTYTGVNPSTMGR